MTAEELSDCKVGNFGVVYTEYLVVRELHVRLAGLSTLPDNPGDSKF